MSVITAQPRLSENYTLAPNEDVIDKESNDTNLMENQDASDEQKKKKEERIINGEVETCCCPALHWIVECTDCCGEFFADCIQQCCENSSPSGGDISNDTSGCCDLGCGDGGCGDADGCCDSSDD